MNKGPLYKLSELSGELKRRGVYPVVAAYAVICWVLLQIAEVTFEPLLLPEWAMTLMVFLVIFGFPVVVILSWFFDVTRKGIRLDEKVSEDALPGDERPSIAVLPFADMSAERNQGYFCEGVAEEILNALTKIRQLRVAARSSSFQYNATAGDVRSIGRELGVNAILEGSVRKADEHLRVTAQLVNVASGYHLWTKSFDKELKDIFVIQDEIAMSIADALLETLTPQEQSTIKTTSSKDVTAYDYYLRGRQFMKRLQKLDIEFARQMFEQAIEIDPDFGLAWAGFADCHSLLVMYEDPVPRYRTVAHTASQRSIQLDPALAEAHLSRGLAFLISEEFALAEAEFKTALELNAALYEAYYYYGRARFHQGDLEGAAELFKQAAEVDPTEYQARCLRVQILRGLGRSAKAAREAKKVVALIEKYIEWNPDDSRALHLGAGSLIVLGETERAKSWLQRALEIDPAHSVMLYNVACNYATLGEIDMAFNCLEQAIDNGVVNTAWMRNDMDLEPLRSDPRYAMLLEQLNDKRQYLQAAS